MLTGVLAALLAQGLEPFEAASAGVWLHAAAGREAARRQGAVEGVIAARRDRGAAGGARARSAHERGQRAQASVNVAAIERNCSRLRAELRAGAELCAVVKADGYGHGAASSARAALAGGASWLAVAGAQEARELREAGIDAAPILVMGALSVDEVAQALSADADVVVWSERYVRAVAEAGGGRVHVKLDSGMGRLGTRDAGLAARVFALARDTRGRRAGRADDALRDRRRTRRRRLLRAPARHVRALGARAQAAATRS